MSSGEVWDLRTQSTRRIITRLLRPEGVRLGNPYRDEPRRAALDNRDVETVRCAFLFRTPAATSGPSAEGAPNGTSATGREARSGDIMGHRLG